MVVVVVVGVDGALRTLPATERRDFPSELTAPTLQSTRREPASQLSFFSVSQYSVRCRLVRSRFPVYD